VTVLDLFRPPAHVAAFAASANPDPTQPPVMIAAPAVAEPGSLGRLLRSDRALDQINESVGMSIPAVRRAVHVIAGTISTFGLAAWRDGARVPPGELAGAGLTWLAQPDPVKTLSTTMAGTLQDAIWRDRSYWRVLDRYVDGWPARYRRIQPDRVSVVPDELDPDLLDQIIIDGASVAPANVLMINWAGIGGLRRWGFELLDLYLALQTAAGRYAVAPHPKAILKNHGADLAGDEIELLLTRWESARDTRSVGYLNDVVDYETFGWNASEMQLTEAREHAALEVARLFGLPAWALDATGGDSMTYSNVTDRRLDLLEALRPWMTPAEQYLSTRTRRGVTITFDASAYTRDSPEARMRTWQSARAAGVLTTEEIRRVEPLADLAAGSPDQPGPAPTPAAPAMPAGGGVGNPPPGASDA
jgi:Phage portal protein